MISKLLIQAIVISLGFIAAVGFALKDETIESLLMCILLQLYIMYWKKDDK